VYGHELGHDEVHPLPGWHVDPQPSDEPQATPEHAGVQVHPLPGWQVDPQPSEDPQAFPLHTGVQVQPLPG
jgi:hypothetical protein